MRWKVRLKCSGCLLILLLPWSAFAADDDFFQWHTTNVQLLRGSDYKLGSEERTLMTLEHANGWKYGDFHFFLDRTWPDDGKPFYYFEPTLRVSLSKVTGYDFSYGIVKDVLVSANLEKPKGQDPRLLGGGSIDLNLPGFKFFKTNLWLRDNPYLDGQTYQVTLAWNRPFQLGETRFLIEGFADFAGSEGATNSHQLVVPRFLLNVGDLTGIGTDGLWAGVEYSYWRNKFGNKGVTESVPQLQLKWVF